MKKIYLEDKNVGQYPLLFHSYFYPCSRREILPQQRLFFVSVECQRRQCRNILNLTFSNVWPIILAKLIYIYILLLFYTPVYNTELMPLLEGLIQINDILNCRDMNQPLWVLE